MYMKAQHPFKILITSEGVLAQIEPFKLHRITIFKKLSESKEVKKCETAKLKWRKKNISKL